MQANLSIYLAWCELHKNVVCRLEKSCKQYPTKQKQVISGSVMVSKLDEQTYKSEFESHWVPHSFRFVTHRIKELRKLLPHKTAAVQPPASHPTNYLSKMNNTFVKLLEK